MSQLQEKDSKNEVLVAESQGEQLAGSEESPRAETDGQPYTEPKKTWKSFFWSSETPGINQHGKTSC